MQSRTCQNCKQEIILSPEEIGFLERIKVPPSNYCSPCKLQRRMMFRNERTLYKRENNAPGHAGEQIISIHRSGVPYTIYDDRSWWSDAWDPMEYGSEFDFSKSFFEQYNELYKRMPLINVSITNMVNCQYCNVSEGDKGSYMLSASNKNEDSFYSNRVTENEEVVDCYIATRNELSYELVNCSNNFKVRWAEATHESSDCYYMYNCKSCTDCIGCVNVRNKSYCIFNEQLDRETYLKRKEELRLDTYDGIQAVKERYLKLVKDSIHKYANNIKTVDSTGDNLENTNSVKNAFDIFDAEHCTNVVWGGYGMRDCVDAGPGIGIQSELIYDAFDTALQVSQVYWTSVVYHSFDIRYSINCHGSSHLFGCHGLRNKQYCILNKQYTKEEYELLIPKIIAHMQEKPYVDEKGRVFSYGDFFPYILSPFSYNETVAQEYFPLTKVAALQNGFCWYDREDRNYQVSIKTNEIPQSIVDVEKNIVDQIIECANRGSELTQCTGAFRITETELALYRKIGVPLPRYCYNCRHYNRLVQRNPMKLYHRACMCDIQSHGHMEICTNEFETTYSPERNEKIYCEGCYQKEVI